PHTDLWITKSDGTDTAAPGETLVYTITAGNAGPTAVLGATVTDVLPSGLGAAAWTCAAAGGAACNAPSGTGGISETVDLPLGGTVVYTLTAEVGLAPVTVRNTATIAVPAGVFE